MSRERQRSAILLGVREPRDSRVQSRSLQEVYPGWGLTRGPPHRAALLVHRLRQRPRGGAQRRSERLEPMGLILVRVGARLPPVRASSPCVLSFPLLYLTFDLREPSRGRFVAPVEQMIHLVGDDEKPKLPRE